MKLLFGESTDKYRQVEVWVQVTEAKKKRKKTRDNKATMQL